MLIGCQAGHLQLERMPDIMRMSGGITPDLPDLAGAAERDRNCLLVSCRLQAVFVLYRGPHCHW